MLATVAHVEASVAGREMLLTCLFEAFVSSGQENLSELVEKLFLEEAHMSNRLGKATSLLLLRLINATPSESREVAQGFRSMLAGILMPRMTPLLLGKAPGGPWYVVSFWFCSALTSHAAVLQQQRQDGSVLFSRAAAHDPARPAAAPREPAAANSFHKLQ
jgi:hypothetical protein